MNRGKIAISAELLAEFIPMPEDFKPSGARYDPNTNAIIIYGFSKEYNDLAEGVCIDDNDNDKEGMKEMK